RGLSMVVSVLEGNKDPSTNEAGPDPCSLPALKKPPTRRPSQDVLSGPSGNNKLPLLSTSVRQAVHSVKDSSSRALSCTKAASLTTPAVVLGSTSSPPGSMKTGQEDTSVKETMQVVKETVADTSSVPRIGSCQGSRPLLQKRTDRQRDNSYEDFLKNLYLSNKMESQLNSYLISQSTYSSKGSAMSQEDVSTYLDHFDAQKERIMHREPRFPNKLSLPRILRASEYADKFGFLQKAYPPRISQNTKPAPVSSRIAFPATLLTHGGYDTEYQANYSKK
ncbi:hypothetical protein NFI96_032412, partial [Prochilodus magdalenae]